MNLRITFTLIFSLFLLNTNIFSQNKYEYARAFDGLIMRESPSQSAKKITKIPFGDKVLIQDDLKKIILVGDEYGSWKKVSWNNNEGWVFGGYLRNYDFNEIKKIAASYFRDYFKKEFQSQSERMREIHKDLWAQTENDLEITNILSNIYVIKYIAPSSGEAGISKDKSIWVYNNSWKLLLLSAHTIHLLYLNSDSYPDIISMSGCCVMNDTNVYLGSKDGNLTHVQFLDLNGELKVSVTGSCEKVKLKHFSPAAKNDSDFTEYYFDCKTNKLLFK